MKKLLPGLLASLLLLSQAAPCRAQGGAPATKDEDPLAAALRLTRGLKPWSEKDEVFVRLVDAHREAGRLEEAVRVAGAMDDGGMKALALSRIANRFAESGELERAAELLSESLLVIKRADDDQGLADDLMFEIVRGERRFNYNSFPPHDETRKGALARLFEAGRPAAAEGVLAQVREFALDLDSYDADAAHLLVCAARLYIPSDASLAELADELMRAGQKEAALAVLTEATGPDEKQERSALHFGSAGTLAALGAAYARAGNQTRAAAYFRRALQLAEAQEDLDAENGLRVLIEVGARYAEAGLTPDARAHKSLRNLVRRVESDKE